MLTKTTRADLSAALIDFYDHRTRHQLGVSHADLFALIISDDTVVPPRARELARQRLQEAADHGGAIGQSARTWLDKLDMVAVR